MRAWCNGSLVDPTGPALSVLDHGFTVGDGVFEAIKVVDNEPFALTRHLRRLTRSAKGLGLPDPDHDVVRRAIAATIEGQELGLGRIRVTYTAGISPLGSNRDTKDPSLVVVTAQANPFAPSTKAVVVPWPRNEHGATVGLKTTSYADNVIALAYAAEREASEAIFANTAENLCEGTGTNVFCVFGGTVVTPPLEAGCLAGVTRDLVIEWCGVHERDISMAEFAEADEIFFTSTTRDIQAIHDVDGRPLAEHTVTEQIANEWRKREPQDMDP
jgi:branched-chain amino acid aminotransferase